ncbi:hypothetical protein QNI19_29850 [Cytophagaceae bacterium DM2B3-1]|uniref:Uncharacterized protein n=2 Tax=Xanthocytophaga TaxID=3078918 RepID=A0AAE3R0H0_9BACT|nr:MULTISPECIES: hypothetical protein [Xanthocytophaga]MDJ1471796.1 hypothetical protein [Xanthocytophaga flavus]MDJ1485858.1 hypothetical protein [Xanthocytophaga flavus]MDJ1497180.1 hypothetical protein [Xanthocytophaga flavus]MDJ1500244.1 hypothetical protein [Xanthocytophaga agilis]
MNKELLYTNEHKRSYRTFWRWHIGIDLLLLVPYVWAGSDALYRFYYGLSLRDEHALLNLQILTGVFLGYLAHSTYLICCMVYFFFTKDFRVVGYLSFYTVLIVLLTCSAYACTAALLVFGM